VNRRTTADKESRHGCFNLEVFSIRTLLAFDGYNFTKAPLVDARPRDGVVGKSGYRVAGKGGGKSGSLGVSHKGLIIYVYWQYFSNKPEVFVIAVENKAE